MTSTPETKLPSQTSQIGRQHIVLGEDASGRVTISNSEIDGTSDWSATCDGKFLPVNTLAVKILSKKRSPILGAVLHWIARPDYIQRVSTICHRQASGKHDHALTEKIVTTFMVRVDAPRRSPATHCSTQSTTTGRTTLATPSRSLPAPRFLLKATRSPASRRQSRMPPPVEACSPSTTAPPLLLASSTLAALALSTLSATLAISLVLPTRASCLTLVASRLLLLTRLLPRLSRAAPVLARSERWT